MTLRVKLEIVPHGDESKAYEIGRLDIFNKGQFYDTQTFEYGAINLSPGDVGLYDSGVFHDRPDGAWQLVRETIDVLAIKGPK